MLKLTTAERLMLWNQYEILKHLNKNNADDYSNKQEIISNGYEQFYSELLPMLYVNSVSPEETREVQDILDMFRAIDASCRKHGYKPKSHHAEFDGFDGNNDQPQYGFAHFVRRNLGHWGELKDRPDNSHSSVSLRQYRNMLQTWYRLDKSFDLTPGQIEMVAYARV